MKSADERKSALDEVSTKLFESFVTFSYSNKDGTSGVDKVKDYGRVLLQVDCFYLEYCDAIREGDGEHALRCWRYLLPIFLGSHCVNYSCEVLNMLFQHLYALPPRLSAQLLWSRFINVHGLPGKNIPGNLHMEHLNRLAKEAIKGLGANKTKRGIARVGRALGTIGPALHQFDYDNNISTESGLHNATNSEKDTKIIVEELLQHDVLGTVPGRKHKSFPNSMLHAKTVEEQLAWASAYKKLLYECKQLVVFNARTTHTGFITNVTTQTLWIHLHTMIVVNITK